MAALRESIPEPGLPAQARRVAQCGTGSPRRGGLGTIWKNLSCVISNIRHKLFGLIWLGLVCSLIGCVSLATDYRKYGFDMVQRGFALIDEVPNLYEVVELKNVKVHIVGHRRFFNYGKAAAYGSPIGGYANRRNEIWLFGRTVKGKIVLNQVILGHELNHLLNFKNPKIADPDKLDELGG